MVRSRLEAAMAAMAAEANSALLSRFEQETLTPS
jgi:hypothetical protein